MTALAVTVDRVLAVASRLDNRPVMTHVTRSVDELKRRFREPLRVVETGTIRSYTELHESTRLIAERLGEDGTLTSIDISPEAIEVSRDICRHLHNIEWVEADSVSYLAGLGDERFHFAFLDSVNDETAIYNEFAHVVPRIVEGGIVMIDDAGVTSTWHGIDQRSDGRKGQSVWRFLEGCRADYEVLRCPGGRHGTQLRVDLSGSNAVTIRDNLRSAPTLPMTLP